MSRPILAVDIDGVISLFGFEEPPDRDDASFELVDGMVALHLAAGRRAAAAAGRALRAGLGQRLGGQSELLPAQLLGLPELPHVSFDGAARFGSAHWKLGPLDEYAHGPGDGLDRRQLRRELLRVGASARRSRPCWSRPSPHLGLEEAHVRGLERRWAQPVSRLTPVDGVLADLLPARRAEDPGLGRALARLVGEPGDTRAEEAAEDSDGGFKRRGRGRAARAARAAGPTAAAPRLPLPACPPGGRTRVVRAALRSLLSLAPDLAQIGMEVDLDRMTLRGDEALPHLPLPRPRSPPASPPPAVACARPPSRSATHSACASASGMIGPSGWMKPMK